VAQILLPMGRPAGMETDRHMEAEFFLRVLFFFLLFGLLADDMTENRAN